MKFSSLLKLALALLVVLGLPAYVDDEEDGTTDAAGVNSADGQNGNCTLVGANASQYPSNHRGA